LSKLGPGIFVAGLLCCFALRKNGADDNLVAASGGAVLLGICLTTLSAINRLRGKDITFQPRQLLLGIPLFIATFGVLANIGPIFIREYDGILEGIILSAIFALVYSSGKVAYRKTS
jgi:hypothetical protein